MPKYIFDDLNYIYQNCKMNPKTDKSKLFTKDLNLIKLLEFRLDLITRVPSRTNIVMAFDLMETIIVDKFKKNEIQNLDDKLVDRYEKCKNLALGSESKDFLHERKLAFSKSLEFFQKITKIEFFKNLNAKT